MELHIAVNGKTDKGMDMVDKFGLMVQFMKDIGEIIKQMDKED